jgi:hypothetical protein
MIAEQTKEFSLGRIQNEEKRRNAEAQRRRGGKSGQDDRMDRMIFKMLKIL